MAATIDVPPPSEIVGDEAYRWIMTGYELSHIADMLQCDGARNIHRTLITTNQVSF